MRPIWGIHNNRKDLDFVGERFVAIGWDDVGDLRAIGDEREALKTRLVQTHPSAKAGAYGMWAGVLLRFGFEMEAGDLVVHPRKADSTLAFARVTGDYYFDPGAEVHRHRRPVEWLKVGIPRTQFSKSARYEVGAAVTLFKVSNYADEFRAFLDAGAVPSDLALADAESVEAAEDEPSAERILDYTRDFVIETLSTQIDGYAFEHFTAHLLEAMGYRTQVTQASGDGGFDIVAHRDPLGIEPPIIKVQCKRTVGTIGGPDVQALAGALAQGGQELGLFVTLGSYSKDALHIERVRQDLRLIDGQELVRLVYEHYDKFSPEWKRLLPMRSVFVVDHDPEAG